ncbi:hypothetical protein THZB04_250009 [Vibrio owensii]|nr:hypothetical protein THZB04_250009 [Vibrio owensii]
MKKVETQQSTSSSVDHVAYLLIRWTLRKANKLFKSDSQRVAFLLCVGLSV